MKRDKPIKEVFLEQKTNDAVWQIEKKKEKEFVNLIAEIIVDLTFKQAYEKGNTIPEV